MLSFRLGPFPVQVYPWFFLSAVLLGSEFGFGWRMLAWILIVFVSVLFHELGHAVVGKAFGGRPQIHLQAFGGLTFPMLGSRPGPLKQFILSLAGPVFGLILGALAYALVQLWPPAPGSPVAFTMTVVVWVSVVWQIFNLLPILPLDGGQMMLAALEGVRRKPSVALASWISAAVCVLVGAAATLVRGFDPFLLIFLVLFMFQNVQRARQAELPAPAAEAPSLDSEEQADVEAVTARIRSHLANRAYGEALAAVAALEGRTPFRSAAALRLRAGIELARGDNEAAALFAGQSFSLWPSPDAAVVAARANLRSGQEDRARNWLRRALESGASIGAVRNDPELGALA